MLLIMAGDDPEGPGGIASVVRQLRNGGLFERWNVRYVCTYRGSGMRRQLAVFSRSAMQVASLLYTGQVALVHLHMTYRGSFWRKRFIAWIARAYGVPVVLHIHSGGFEQFYEALGRVPHLQRMVRRTLRSAVAVVCLTDAMANVMHQIEPRSKIVVIGNPGEFSTPHARPLIANRTIVFLGRLISSKGIFELVQAMQLIVERFPDAQLVLAGPGDQAPILRDVRKLGLERHVSVPGFLDKADRDRLLQRAAVLVVPSHFEAFPMVILEAAAAGVPIVATSVGGIPELLTNGVTGILVPPHAPHVLFDGVSRLFDDTHLALRIGQACHADLRRRYAREVIISEFESLYSRLISPEHFCRAPSP
jgi:glycosyltransferase involved in cell wall biosynthesis